MADRVASFSAHRVALRAARGSFVLLMDLEDPSPASGVSEGAKSAKERSPSFSGLISDPGMR